jgi:hypothetical protein
MDKLVCKSEAVIIWQLCHVVKYNDHHELSKESLCLSRDHDQSRSHCDSHMIMISMESLCLSHMIMISPESLCLSHDHDQSGVTVSFSHDQSGVTVCLSHDHDQSGVTIVSLT